MPTYIFEDSETGDVWEDLMSIADMEALLEAFPNFSLVPQAPTLVAGVGDRIKNDDGWKENLSRIGAANPNSKLGESVGPKDPKTVATRTAIDKWRKARTVYMYR